MAKTVKVKKGSSNKTTTKPVVTKNDIRMQKVKNRGQKQTVKTIGKTVTAVSATTGSTATANKATEEANKTQREALRQATHQAALNKWNGVIMNTPDPAEGTSEPTDGSRGPDNYTGTQWGFTE